MKNALLIFLIAIIGAGCASVESIDVPTIPSRHSSHSYLSQYVSEPRNDGTKIKDRKIMPKDRLVIHRHVRQDSIYFEFLHCAVDTDGAITIPDAGKVKVKELTLRQANSRLEEYLRESKQSHKGVFVSMYIAGTWEYEGQWISEKQAGVHRLPPTKYYNIAGDVHRANEYPIEKGITLLKAIGIAGGIKQSAGKNVSIKRYGHTKSYNIAEIAKDAAVDPEIMPSDVITVHSKELVKDHWSPEEKKRWEQETGEKFPKKPQPQPKAINKGEM